MFFSYTNKYNLLSFFFLQKNQQNTIDFTTKHTPLDLVKSMAFEWCFYEQFLDFHFDKLGFKHIFYSKSGTIRWHLTFVFSFVIVDSFKSVFTLSKSQKMTNNNKIKKRTMKNTRCSSEMRQQTCIFGSQVQYLIWNEFYLLLFVKIWEKKPKNYLKWEKKTVKIS